MSDYYSDEDPRDAGQDPMNFAEGRKETWRAPIFNLANALGGTEDVYDEATDETLREYRLGDECLACLRDLRRWWNEFGQDDDDRIVARLMAECGLFGNDLVPILKISAESGSKGFKTAVATINLMLLMTWPVNVAEELRDAALMDQDLSKVDYAGLQAILRTYKASIVRSKSVQHIFAVLVQILEKKKERDFLDRDRMEKNDNLISMVLHLVRNLLAIQDKPSSSYQTTESVEQASLQSELLVQMQECELFSFLLTAASLTDTRDWSSFNLILLDIFHLSFRLARPEELAKDLRAVRNDQLSDLLSAESRLKRADSRKGASRHNRFGTTVSLNNGDRRYVMHKQAAVFKSPTKVMDGIKKGQRQKARADDELAPPLGLTTDALRSLRVVALGFLEGAGNNYFYSVLRDLKKDQAKELDNTRYFSLVSFFLEFFLLLQESEKEQKVDHASEEGHDFDLVAELTDEDAMRRIVVRMRQAAEEKPVNTVELHATIRALTAILRTVEALAKSAEEEYKDSGNLLQHKLYYDAEWLELILSVVSKCKDESRKYVESAVELTHVILKMLEEYSKNNEFVTITKKRKNQAARKRAKGKSKAQGEEEDAIRDHASDEEMAEYDAEQQAADYGTHHFQFSSFEQKFATEGVLGTLMAYLGRYKSFTFEYQIKHVVKLLHRQAVKAKAVGLFFKASVLHQFRQILDDRKSLPKTRPWNDLFALIQYILKEFFKAARVQPILLIEIFYPVRTSDVKKMIRKATESSTLQDLSDDDLGEEGGLRLNGDGTGKGGRGKGSRGKKSRRSRRSRRAADGSSGSESEPDEAAERRARRRAEAEAAIKSAQFIDSDEDATDDERDRAFFAQEQERKRLRDEAASKEVPVVDTTSKRPKKKQKVSAPEQAREDVGEAMEEDDDALGRPAASDARDASKDASGSTPAPLSQVERKEGSPEVVAGQHLSPEPASSPEARRDGGVLDDVPSSPEVAKTRKRAVIADSDDE